MQCTNIVVHHRSKLISLKWMNFYYKDEARQSNGPNLKMRILVRVDNNKNMKNCNIK